MPEGSYQLLLPQGSS